MRRGLGHLQAAGRARPHAARRRRRWTIRRGGAGFTAAGVSTRTAECQEWCDAQWPARPVRSELPRQAFDVLQLYETQRAADEPVLGVRLHLGCAATASPFAHAAGAACLGGRPMHRLAKEYEKPEFNIHSVNVDGSRWRCSSAWRWPNLSGCCAQRFTDDSNMLTQMKDQADRARRRAAVGPPLDAAARDGARGAAPPQRSSSPTGRTRAWCRPRSGRSTWTTTSPTCRSSSVTSAPMPT